MNDVPGCFSCDLIHGRKEAPGGRILTTDLWLVEHCIGPLPLGTLVLKPRRHVLAFSDLQPAEVAEFGPLLHSLSTAVKIHSNADQVYICLWSHRDWQTGKDFAPGHIHFVIQPAWNAQRRDHEKPGPFLQADLFRTGAVPPTDQIGLYSGSVRLYLQQHYRPSR